MKKITFLIVSIFCFATLKAQDSATYAKNLNLLLADAQNNFEQSQGALNSEDTAKKIKYYEPKITFNSSKQFIQQNMDDNSKVALYYFDWNDINIFSSSSQLLTAALDIINKMHSSGKFRGKDFDNTDGSSTTELKDINGNYIMELTTSNKDKYLKILVYSKSWGKR